MKRNVKWRIAAMLISLLMVTAGLFGVTAFAADTTGQVTITGDEDYGYAQQVLALTNAERAKVGKKALVLNPDMSKAAMLRAAELAVLFSHTRPDGTNFNTSYKWASFSGENIAITQETPEKVMESWMNSQGHRENILGEAYAGHIQLNYTSIGIGCFYHNEVYYWVQLFDGSTPSAAKTKTSKAKLQSDNVVEATRTIETKEEYISLSTSQEKSFSLNVGETVKVDTGSILHTNTKYSRAQAIFDAESFTFATGNEAIATVAKNGTITATGGGNTTVKAYIKGLPGTAIDFAVAVDGHRHEFGTWQVTTPATCSKEGVETRMCATCEENETRAIPKLEHEFGAWQVTTPATCAKEGVETRKCTLCETEETKAIPKLEHEFGAWQVTTPATCTKEGVETRKCTLCETEETRAIPKLEHEFGAWQVTTPATCTKEGVETRKCTLCEKEETRAIKKTGHSYGKWKVTTAPTCTKEGKETRTCTECKYTKARKVAATGHNYGGWKQTKAPTCTQEGSSTRTCKNCKTTETKAIAATGHDYGEAVIVKAPTMTQEGYKEKTCKSCGVRLAETLPATVGGGTGTGTGTGSSGNSQSGASSAVSSVASSQAVSSASVESIVNSQNNSLPTSEGGNSTTSEPQPQPAINPTAMYVLIGVVAAALLLGIGAILYSRKKQKEQLFDDDGDDEEL